MFPWLGGLQPLYNAASSTNQFTAENYDLLVDAPVEIGTFRECDFELGGGHYRVVVDADPADYEMDKVVSTVRNGSLRAGTDWMNDRPFDSYLFLYHFSARAGRGRHGAFLQHGD